MENSSSVSSLEVSEKPNIKFIIFGVVIALIYTVPLAMLLITVTPVSALLLAIGGGTGSEALASIFFVVGTGISLIIIIATAFLSGWAAYRSANESGAIWNSVIGTLVSVIVCFIGAFVFSIASIFILDALYEPYAASEDSMIGIFPIGIALGLGVAYIVAVISGAVTHRILARRSAAKKSIKIEKGVS